MGQFQPEFIGKMNFYLSAIDELLWHTDDHPSIGIILCKSKNKIVAEYALQDLGKPVGVSEYRLKAALPSRWEGNLPTIDELERKIKDKPVLGPLPYIAAVFDGTQGTDRMLRLHDSELQCRNFLGK